MHKQGWISESLNTPVLGKYDVIVCGGGVAGVSAAVAARRNGASVLLLEKAVALGGLATIGLISWYEPICDGRGRRVMGGMPEELMNLSIKYGFATLPEGWKNSRTSDESARCATHFSHSLFSLALSEWITDAGVDILLDTAVVNVSVDDGHINGVFVENKDGRGYYEADMVVDATGDADVAVRAGVPCEDGISYLTYIAYYTDAERSRAAADSGNMFHGRKWMNSGSDLWGNGHPKDMPYFKGISAKDQTRFVLEGQRRLMDMVRGMPGESREFTTLPSMAQYRKTRRMIGDYTMLESDAGTRQEDSVGVAGDFVHRGILYELPYRILFSSRIDNLFAAGRNVSSTGWAWDVTRVIPVAVATGEAAGTAAALCVKNGKVNHSLDVAMLQSGLADGGVCIHLDQLALKE